MRAGRPPLSHISNSTHDRAFKIRRLTTSPTVIEPSTDDAQDDADHSSDNDDRRPPFRCHGL